MEDSYVVYFVTFCLTESFVVIVVSDSLIEIVIQAVVFVRRLCRYSFSVLSENVEKAANLFSMFATKSGD